MTKNTQNTAIEIIKSTMGKLNLTQEELASVLGRAQPTISEILRGKRLISPEIAIELESAFNGAVSAARLLELQSFHQLEMARKTGKSEDVRLKSKLRFEFPIAEMEKRGWIPKSDDMDTKLAAVLAFANKSVDLDQIRPAFESQPLARQSATLGCLSPSSSASRAWQYRVRHLAEMTPVKNFNHSIFEDQGLNELRSLVRNAKDIARVPQVLAKYGIRFVVVEHLKSTKLEGIATWLDSTLEKNPVVALTLRMGNIGSFWFNLAHEIHHIKLKHAFSINDEAHCDAEEGEEGLQYIEKEADDAAANWLIPKERFEAFCRRHKGRFSEASILAFSEMVNVHPGVLVGMLQHRRDLPYSRFTHMKVDIRKFILMAVMADGFGLPVVNKGSTRH